MAEGLNTTSDIPGFDTVLIANRGEIAARIQRACRELGLKTVAICSEADRQAPYGQTADTFLCVGPANAAKSYLNQNAILIAARLTGAGAIHPGYGFLSENAAFSQAVEDAGLVFIGPDARSISTMGDKIAAKRAMIAAGVPCVPGPDTALPEDAETVERIANEIGYPIIIKAAGGGGGRGMRVVQEAALLHEAITLTREEARQALALLSSIWRSFSSIPVISRYRSCATRTAMPSGLVTATVRCNVVIKSGRRSASARNFGRCDPAGWYGLRRGLPTDWLSRGGNFRIPV